MDDYMLSKLLNEQLLYAVHYNDVKQVRKILEAGGNANTVDNGDYSVLQKAIQNNHTEIVDLLRQYGATE